MIKATGTNDKGERILMLGLSHRNLDLLRDGKPIRFDGTPYGYGGEIILFAGKDEATMAASIRARNPGIEEHEEPDAP